GLTQQACTGALGAVRVARALLLSEPAWARVLCITADRFPAGACYEQAYNLVSDGAAGCVIAREPSGYRVLGCPPITNGAMVDATADETVGAWFSYSPRPILELLGSLGLRPADLDWIVPQNTHRAAWPILARMIGLSPACIYDTTAENGHVISGDNLI